MKNLIILSLAIIHLFACSRNQKKDKSKERAWEIYDNNINKILEKESTLPCRQYHPRPTFYFDSIAKSNDLLVVEEFSDNKISKKLTEKLKLRKTGVWFAHCFQDTLRSEFEYKIILLRNIDTILSVKLRNIVIGRQPVYRGTICTLVSYELDGKLKTKALTNTYKITKR